MSWDNVATARRNFELCGRGADDELARRLAPDGEWHHNGGMGTPLWQRFWTDQSKALEAAGRPA